MPLASAPLAVRMAVTINMSIRCGLLVKIATPQPPPFWPLPHVLKPISEKSKNQFPSWIDIKWDGWPSGLRQIGLGEIRMTRAGGEAPGEERNL